MSKYVPYSEVRKHYQVRPQTVQNWAKNGRVRYKAIQNSTRKTWLYDLDSIGEFIESSTRERVEPSESESNRIVIYVRVSSKEQEPDLIRQRELLSKQFPNAEIMEDVGSGLNYKRPAFSSLVKRICRDEISQVVVTYKDRLVRFGFELFEQLCDEHSTKILVYCKNDELTGNDENELKDDLLSIITVFVARNNGRRAGYLRHQRKLQGSQNSDPKPNEETKGTTSMALDNIESDLEIGAEFDFEDSSLS